MKTVNLQPWGHVWVDSDAKAVMLIGALTHEGLPVNACLFRTSAAKQHQDEAALNDDRVFLSSQPRNTFLIMRIQHHQTEVGTYDGATWEAVEPGRLDRNL
jgi:hypothetical protein